MLHKDMLKAYGLYVQLQVIPQKIWQQQNREQNLIQLNGASTSSNTEHFPNFLITFKLQPALLFTVM